MTSSDRPESNESGQPVESQPVAKKPPKKKTVSRDWTTLGSVRDSFAVLMEQDILLQRPPR